MTGYCEVEDVRASVSTDLEDHEISDLINETDVFIDLAISGATAKVLRAISRTWTAYRIMLKDPASQKIGPYTDDRSLNLKLLKEEYENMIAAGVSGITFVVGKTAYV